MKYSFDPKVVVSFTPEEFNKAFKGMNPQDAKAEEAVQNYVQAIINSFMNGKLITKEQHDKIVSEERYSAAKEAANDIRFRHGPGGC